MRTQSSDTDLQTETIQLELFRRASVAKRVAAVISLSQSTIELACRAIRRQSPNCGEREVLLRFVAIHHGSELAERLRCDLARRPR